MFKAFAMFFNFITSFFASANNLANAMEAATATVDDRAQAFRKEQSEENSQRLAKLAAQVEHTKANPPKFTF